MTGQSDTAVDSFLDMLAYCWEVTQPTNINYYFLVRIVESREVTAVLLTVKKKKTFGIYKLILFKLSIVIDSSTLYIGMTLTLT